MTLGLQILLISSILCFLKDFKILYVKVVQNDTFKFGTERVKAMMYRMGKNLKGLTVSK